MRILQVIALSVVVALLGSNAFAAMIFRSASYWRYRRSGDFQQWSHCSGSFPVGDVITFRASVYLDQYAPGQFSEWQPAF